jgi:hypothetical protein
MSAISGLDENGRHHKEKKLEKHLHIICLNVPYPVNYGGVFDLFYKLEALKQAGVKIHLHCFKYGRKEQLVLNDLCETLYYYPRNTGISAISASYPYIVNSRRNKMMAETIAKDNYPILMEGVHCTWLLNDKRFEKRKFYVRLHNVEHVYYRHLFSFVKSPIKKIYYLWESYLLKKYEIKIASKATFIAVSQQDAAVYKNLGCNQIHYLPVFLPPWKIKNAEGKGSFCLYQGDLSVAENDKAAKWLLKKIFTNITIPFVIAGKNPSHGLIRLVKTNKSACLIANPDEKEMQDLIEKAHINIIPSYNSTGIKVKLLNALFNGRHCLVNKPTVEGTGLETACRVAEDGNEFEKAVLELYGKSYSENDISIRHQLLHQLFDNQKNAHKLVSYLWP